MFRNIETVYNSWQKHLNQCLNQEKNKNMLFLGLLNMTDYKKCQHLIGCVSDRSEVAILYNDRSVLENHHVSAAYKLMAEEDMNILVNLNKDDWRCTHRSHFTDDLIQIYFESWGLYPGDCSTIILYVLIFCRELRALVIEMVMSTDMSCHFQQIKTMRNSLTQTHRSEL